MGTAQRLAQLIEGSGMTQTAVARRLHLSLNWLSNRTRGITPIKADEIPRLAAVLGVRPADFFEEAAPATLPWAQPEGASPAYAEIFTREVARMWQGEEMTDAEREFLASTLATIHHSIHRYRDRIVAERVPADRPS